MDRNIFKKSGVFNHQYEYGIFALIMVSMFIFIVNNASISNYTSGDESLYTSSTEGLSLIPYSETVRGFIGKDNKTYEIRPALAGLPA